MIEVSDIVRSRSEPVSLVNNDLGFVVESFHRAIVDGRVEIIEQVILSAPKHPGKVAHWLQPRVGRPPEPLIEVVFRPNRITIIPERSEGFFEHVGSVYFQVEFFQF